MSERDEIERDDDNHCCPRCKGLGYIKTRGEPYLDYPCGCTDPDPDAEEDEE